MPRAVMDRSDRRKEGASSLGVPNHGWELLDDNSLRARFGPSPVERGSLLNVVQQLPGLGQDTYIGAARGDSICLQLQYILESLRIGCAVTK
jgi:hypothetical protein